MDDDVLIESEKLLEDAEHQVEFSEQQLELARLRYQLRIAEVAALRSEQILKTVFDLADQAGHHLQFEEPQKARELINRIHGFQQR
jgi:hypothetical protein